MKLSALLLPLLILTFFSCNNSLPKLDDQGVAIDTVGISIRKIDPLHTRINMQDYDASLVEYINSKPNKPTAKKTTIYLLPFGNIKPEIDTIITNELVYLELFFQMPVKILDNVSFEEILENADIKTRMVPDNDYAYYSEMKGNIAHTQNLREQIEASSFMTEYMQKHKPANAVAVLGITEHDIYNPDYNFIFGSSSTKSGVGVISTYRLVDYGSETTNTIRKVASKQITNLFSIRNVKDYSCLLNFHNNITSQMFGEFKLSPRALEKLKYAIGFDYNKRFKELENFWKEEGNLQLEEYYHKVQE
ncbi:MAG: putative Zn-dependent protease [Crocinitomix sp.]|jgi:predicted Zn-dependent protease